MQRKEKGCGQGEITDCQNDTLRLFAQKKRTINEVESKNMFFCTKIAIFMQKNFGMIWIELFFPLTLQSRKEKKQISYIQSQK